MYFPVQICGLLRMTEKSELFPDDFWKSRCKAAAYIDHMVSNEIFFITIRQNLRVSVEKIIG